MQSWSSDRRGTEAQISGVTQALPLVSWEPGHPSHLCYLPKIKFCLRSPTRLSFLGTLALGLSFPNWEVRITCCKQELLV